MKKTVLKTILLGIILTSAAVAKAKQVECRSENNAPIVGGRSGLWKMSFDLYAESDFLRNFSLTTSKVRDAGGVATFFEYDEYADTKTTNRYYMTDPWCDYTIVLPKGISEREGTYKSRVSFKCDDRSKASFEMTCVRTED